MCIRDRIKFVQIGNLLMSPVAGTHSEIIGYRRESLGVASDKEESNFRSCQSTCRCFGNGRCRAKDENALHGLILAL